MSYGKLTLGLALAVTAFGFTVGPAHALSGGGLLGGRGSFEYFCTQDDPIGAQYDFSAANNTFVVDGGVMSCAFSMQADDGSNLGTVTVPMRLKVTYNNAVITANGPTTDIKVTCPSGVVSTNAADTLFVKAGECVPGTGSCADFDAELPGGAFVFQNPQVGAPKGQVSGVCEKTYPASSAPQIDQSVMATWSVTTLPSGGVDATEPVYRFCATPTVNGLPEDCYEILGSGKDKFLYVRGGAGTGQITLIADSQAVNTWNANTSQNGNFNVAFFPNDQVDPHNLDTASLKLNGVPTNGCSDQGTSIQCQWSSPALANTITLVPGQTQVSMIGTGLTLQGTNVIFFVVANISGNI